MLSTPVVMVDLSQTVLELRMPVSHEDAVLKPRADFHELMSYNKVIIEEAGDMRD